MRRHVGAVFDPIADPLSAAYQLRRQASKVAELHRGVIHDAVPYLHAYRVGFEHLVPSMVCTMGTQTSLLPIGARQYTTLLPGTVVWVAWTPQMTYGVIVMVEPHPSSVPTDDRPDRIHATSRCGIKVDRAHEAVFRSRDKGQLQNWASGRPIDSLPIGEYGAITETGLRVHLDSFMGQLAADEATGVFVFYHDQLLRLAGVNLETFSAGHVDVHKDDEGEILIYQGWTPYPWEQLGAFKPGTNPSTTNEADAVQNTTPYYASLEPAEDDQLPFHRRVFLGGYLGQGGKDMVVAPPTDPGQETLTQSLPQTPEALPAGVLEEQRALTGMYLVRSAKGLHILKQGAIPAPLSLQRPEDLIGDTAKNYRPAGQGSGGKPHKVAGSLKTNADHPGMQRVAGLLDELAVRRNWEGEHPLAYHKKDWFLAEEKDSPLMKGYVPPPLDQLAKQSVLPPVTPVKLKIDDRYGDVDYYPNEAGLHFLEDGSVVIRDGFGSAIVMSHGNIEQQPAGDSVVRAGRNIIHWAGRDVIAKARGCVDISAATGSVRQKAETDFQVLAGNSGKGGLLLESRGADKLDFKNKIGTDATGGGIMFKATEGTIIGWGQNLYFRAMEAGSIYLDADKGQGNITAVAAIHTRYCVSNAVDYFGDPASVTASNMFSEGENQFGAPLAVDGGITTAGDMLVKGSINVVQGHIFTEYADDYEDMVGSFGDPKVTSSYKDDIQSEQKSMKANNKDGSKAFSGPITKLWYTAGLPGESKTIDQVGFSFRTTKQYKTTDYTCWETFWQQLLREAQITTDLWTESPVTTSEVDTMPYPGQERLTDKTCFLQQPLSLFDTTNGVAISRGDNQGKYEAPEYAKVKKTAIDGVYPVVDVTAYEQDK